MSSYTHCSFAYSSPELLSHIICPSFSPSSTTQETLKIKEKKSPFFLDTGTHSVTQTGGQ